MGITGLLKGLSPLLVPENELDTPERPSRGRSKAMHNIRQFRDKTIAVDASSWLYKAAYATSERLVEAIEDNRIDPICERILCKYMMKRCEELLNHASIRRIYLVFDGKRCPMKAVTNKEREDKRQANLQEARRLKSLGMRTESSEKYQKCVKVVSWMSGSVKRAVDEKWGNNPNSFAEPRVKCIFSPYEADAQLAKLCIDGIVDAVVTEDSDLLVYSAACGKSFPVIYKLDKNNGDCDVVSMDWLLNPNDNSTVAPRDPMGLPSMRRVLPWAKEDVDIEVKGKKAKAKKKKTGNAMLSHLQALSTREERKKGSGARMFVQACVLAGCDYAPSQLHGVGIVNAFKQIKENAHRLPETRYLHLLKAFPKEKLLALADHNEENDANTTRRIKREDISAAVEKYEELLAQSECVFYYHRVLDKTGKVVSLVDNLEANEFLPSTERFDDESFIGDFEVSSQTTILSRGTKTISNLSSTFPKHQSGNPYTKKTSTTKKSGNQPILEEKKSTNMFSFYARKGTQNSVKNLHLKTSRLQRDKVKEDKRKQLLKDILSVDDSDGDSDEELDEAPPLHQTRRNSRGKDQSGINQNATNEHNEDFKNMLDTSSDEELDEVSPFSSSLTQNDLEKEDQIITRQDEIIRCNSERKGIIHNVLDYPTDEDFEKVPPSTSSKIQKSSLKRSVTDPDDPSDEELEEVMLVSSSQTPKDSVVVSQRSSDSMIVDSSPSSDSSASCLNESNNGPQKMTSRFFSHKRAADVDPMTIVTNTCSRSDSSSEKRIVSPTMAEDVQHNEELISDSQEVVIDDDDDDDDCIIIDDSNSKVSAFNAPLIRQQPSRSTFSQAQQQGTRARFSSNTIKNRSSRKASKRKFTTNLKQKGLGNSNKRTRATSIKGFFQPLKTKT